MPSGRHGMYPTGYFFRYLAWAMAFFQWHFCTGFNCRVVGGIPFRLSTEVKGAWCERGGGGGGAAYFLYLRGEIKHDCRIDVAEIVSTHHLQFLHAIIQLVYTPVL